MKLSLLLAAAWATLLSASIAAGPYQTLLFWEAYRMEIASGIPVGQTTVAKSCVRKPAGTAGPCRFSEFIMHILLPVPATRGNRKQPLESAIAAKYDSLDVINAENLSKNLQTTFQYDSYINLYNLDEATFASKPATAPKARAALGDAALQPKLDNVRAAAFGTYNVRTSDFAYASISGLQQAFKKDPAFQLVEVSPRNKLPNGVEFRELDLAATLAKNPGKEQKIKDAITKLEAKKHHAASKSYIPKVLEVYTALQDPPPAAC
ncbi:hypothetical protein B0T19DRAFT_399471 [Cercophora scortea]|uniref:Uncharacterized protein n=1 Tax=Cercophora scortea TaxID=314031 RepID=A0AAE0IYU4_9PEZI|nr:hypothetical protein B0T19DRAFT_399471 [Cercophora scortea]